MDSRDEEFGAAASDEREDFGCVEEEGEDGLGDVNYGG